MKIKIRLILYFVLLAIAIYLMVVLFNLKSKSNISLPRDYDEIMLSEVFNIVTDYNTFGYFVAEDTIGGFQYELIKELENDWNIKVNLFLENSLDDNLKGLDERKYDVVARNIPVNTSLRQRYNFTQPINKNKYVLVQRKAIYNDSIDPIRQQLDLANKTIFVHKDSPAIMRLQNLANEIGDTIFIEENDTYEEEQLVMMVAGGDIDFTVCNEKVAKKLAPQLPEIDIDTALSFTQLESWALRKESTDLLDSLNNWLSHILDTNEFKKMVLKYE